MDNSYAIFASLLEKRNITPYRIHKMTGIATATLSDWKNGKSTPKNDKMKLIADCLGVTVDYLMTGKELPITKNDEFNKRDRRDISKSLNTIMEEIENDDDSPLFYEGGPISEKHKELLRNAIELALEDAKRKNKILYNPHKNKPNN